MGCTANFEPTLTYEAEYIALTQLQADAFITRDGRLASAMKDLIVLAPFEVLSQAA